MQQHQYKTTGGSFNIKVVMLISPKSAFRIGQVSTAHKSWNARLGCNWLFNPILPQTVLYAQQRRRTRWEGQVHGNTEHEPCFGSRLLGRKQTFVRSRRVQSWPIGKTGEGEEEAECLHTSVYCCNATSHKATDMHGDDGTERVNISPHSRLLILKPHRTSASADISFKEPQCIAVHLSEGS